jgi:hypothetical protein
VRPQTSKRLPPLQQRETVPLPEQCEYLVSLDRINCSLFRKNYEVEEITKLAMPGRNLQDVNSLSYPLTPIVESL